MAASLFLTVGTIGNALAAATTPRDTAMAHLEAGRFDAALAAANRLDGNDKAKLLCQIAGHVSCPNNLDIVRRAVKLLEAGLKETPKDAQAKKLLTECRDYLRSVEGVRAGSYERVTERTKMRLHQRMTQADVLLKRIGETRPLYYRARLWLGRIHYWHGREGGSKKEYALAAEYFAPVKEKYPKDRIVRMYTGEQVPWGGEYVGEESKRAPKWAAKQREALCRLLDVYRWWVEHKQIETGEMGGGWGDDCEMLRNWPVAVLAADDQVILRGWKKLAEGIWNSSILLNGYAKNMTDVEHGAEPFSDTHPMLALLDYGNPKFIERCMTNIRGMHTYWTAINSAGHRHFRSHYFSATEIHASPRHATDTCYCARAAKPGIWLAWYNRDLFLMQFLREWADAWVEDAFRNDGGKPVGIIPGNVDFKTDRIGRYRPWYKGYFGWDFEAFGLMHEFLIGMYALTGDEKYAAPVVAALDLCANPGRWGPQLTKHNRHGEVSRCADDKMEGEASLLVKWPRSATGFKKRFPATDFEGKQFTLHVKPLSASVSNVTISFYDKANLRVARHTWRELAPGKWHKLAITVGVRNDTPSFERNKGDLAEVSSIHFYAFADEKRGEGQMLWDGFRETVPQPRKELIGYEETFDSAEPIKPGTAAWASERMWYVTRQAAEKWRVLSGDTRYDAHLATHGSPYMQWLLSKNRQDKRILVAGCEKSIASTKHNFELLTNEVIYTDRVAVRGAHELLSMYTGGVGNATYYPTFAVTWKNTGKDFAALVAEASDTTLKVLAYNFAAQDRTARATLWRLLPGYYELTQGHDDDQDDKMDRADMTRTVRVSGRSSEVALTLPARTLQVIELRQVDPGRPAEWILPDVAIGPSDIHIVPATPSVGQDALALATVHNLGGAGAGRTKIVIRTHGTELAKRVIEDLPPPQGLLPSTVQVWARIPSVKLNMQVRVELEYGGQELTTANNAASTTIPTADKASTELTDLFGSIALNDESVPIWCALVTTYEAAKRGDASLAAIRIAQAKARMLQRSVSKSESRHLQQIIDALSALDRPSKRTGKVETVATIEAEQMPEKTQVRVVSIAGASADRAIEMAHTTARAAIKLKLARGVHAIDIRGLGPAPESDGFYVEVEGAGVQRSYFPSPQWCQAGRLWFDIEEAGEYKLTILCAEVKAVVDRIVVTKHE